MMRRILVFDDNPQLQGSCEYMHELTEWEFVLTAEQDILERLGRERFDLILLDLMIAPTIEVEGKKVQNVQFPGTSPFWTGLEFLRRLRNAAYVMEAGQGTAPDVPVIAFTAVGSEEAAREMKGQWGVKDFIDKPFDVAELVEAMKQALEG